MAGPVYSQTFSACVLALNLANMLWQAGMIDHSQLARTMLTATHILDGSQRVESGIRSMVRVWAGEVEEEAALPS